MITIAVSWLARLSLALSQFFAIRLLTDNFDEGIYTVFLIVIGLSGWFLLFESGMGPFVQNLVATKTRLVISEQISISFYWVCLINIFVLTLLYFISPKIGEVILGRFSELDGRIELLFFICFILYFFQTLGNISVKYYFGVSKGAVGSGYLLIHSAFSLVLLFLVISLNWASSSLELLISWLILPALFGLLYFLSWFKNYYRHLPLRKILSASGLKSQFNFFAIAILAICVVQIDYLILSIKAAPEEILVYSIYSKIFIFGYFLFNSVMWVRWTKFSVLFDSKNISQIKKEITYLVLSAFIFSFLLIFSVYSLQDVAIPILFPEIPYLASFDLVLAFFGLTFFRCFSDVFATFLQATGNERTLVYMLPVQAVISFLAQWFLYDIYGLQGVVLGLAASFLFTMCWYLPLYSKHTLRNIKL